MTKFSIREQREVGFRPIDSALRFPTGVDLEISCHHATPVQRIITCGVRSDSSRY
jgi:hypothetical protein